MLAPVPRSRHHPTPSNRDIKVYHLSRANGEAPIKLFIRCVGEHGERVMVRVGGGWADLGEYLKEYAIHHGRRSNHGGESRLEVRDAIPRSASSMSVMRPRSGSSLSTHRPSASPPAARPSPPEQARQRDGRREPAVCEEEARCERDRRGGVAWATAAPAHADRLRGQ